MDADKRVSYTGDVDFEKDIILYSDSPLILQAKLNHSVRNIILHIANSLLFKDFSISNNCIKLVVRAYNQVDHMKLFNYISQIVEITKSVSKNETIESMLRENFYSEKNEEVKLKLFESIRSITNRLIHDDLTFLEAAFKAKQPKLRFSAARLLGDKANGSFADIFSKSYDDLKIEILEFLSIVNNKESAFSFIPFIVEEKNTAVQAALINYLGKHSSARVLTFLHKQLKENIPHELCFRSAIIKLLGLCGNYESIELLNKIHGLALKKYINQAIASIQNRIGTGGSGWLSIKKDSRALSIAGDEDN